MKYPERMKALREDHDLTQKTLADMLGILFIPILVNPCRYDFISLSNAQNAFHLHE